jgi:hypothetical protein
VARYKRAARDLGAYICFEDEAGQGLRPPKGRTWAPRGARPLVRVRGAGGGRVSITGVADLRAAALGRALLQAGQRRAGLGRLPGPLRHRHPPPPGAGQLRILLLLVRLARRAAPARAGPGQPGREGALLPGLSTYRHARPALRHEAGPARCASSAAG